MALVFISLVLPCPGNGTFHSPLSRESVWRLADARRLATSQHQHLRLRGPAETLTSDAFRRHQPRLRLRQLLLHQQLKRGTEFILTQRSIR